MGKKQVISLVCPHCSSQKIILNGHYHNGKPQFFCKSCHKYFYENSAKGYPATVIPFPIIAYLLYFRKKIPTFSNMRKYRRFVSQLLKCVELRDTDVDRHTIRHWLKNYEPIFEEIISFKEARDYLHSIFSKKLKDVPDEVIRAKSHPYKVALRFLEHSLGRGFCVELAHHDPVFFSELVDIVSKQELYCHRLLVDDGRPTGGLFFRGVVQ